MNKDIGELSELEFLIRATKEGLIVSRPFGENQRYDFIVDNGKRRFRIQVKSTNFKEGNHFQITCSHGSKIKKSYNKNDIDFLACYIVPLNIWYILPISIFCKIVKFSLYPMTSKNKSKYEKYRERWNLLFRLK